FHRNAESASVTDQQCVARPALSAQARQQSILRSRQGREMNLLLAMLVPERLVHLSAVDYAIIVFYFGLVIAIGWYLKGRANTGEDFFMAGREMTAWVAGLSLLSAYLGALELLACGVSGYQYAILETHWY